MSLLRVHPISSTLLIVPRGMPAFAKVMFMELGDLPRGESTSIPEAISDDGSTVLGRSSGRTRLGAQASCRQCNRGGASHTCALVELVEIPATTGGCHYENIQESIQPT